MTGVGRYAGLAMPLLPLTLSILPSIGGTSPSQAETSLSGSIIASEYLLILFYTDH
jgi:hypothetical protein